MKTLIAGLGSIGRRHLRNLVALGERDIVLYRTHHATLPDDELKDYPVETDLEKALAHKPDIVVVANPTALHLDVAIPAARAGCTLLLEKPISHTVDGINDLRAAVKSGGGQVLVGFQFRFHPGLQQIERLLKEGAIGRVISGRAHWGEYLPNWHPWENYQAGYAARPDLGGGVVLTLCHPLDYLLWLLGDVTSVVARAGTLGDLQIAVEDTAEIIMSLDGGALASVHLNYNQRPPSHHLEIIGTQGTIRWDNADGIARVYRVQTETWEAFPPPADFERNQMFLAETQHLLALAADKERSVCSLEDGIRALELTQAVCQSSGANGAPINL